MFLSCLYLPAWFVVITMAVNSCGDTKHHSIRSSGGYIAGPVIDADQPCLIIFNIPSGKKLNVTFYDFASCSASGSAPGGMGIEGGGGGGIVGVGSGSMSNHQECPAVDQRANACVRITEPSVGSSDSSFCAGGSQRARQYLSSSSGVHLQLNTVLTGSSTKHSRTLDRVTSVSDTRSLVTSQPIRYVIHYEGEKIWKLSSLKYGNNKWVHALGVSVEIELKMDCQRINKVWNYQILHVIVVIGRWD